MNAEISKVAEWITSQTQSSREHVRPSETAISHALSTLPTELPPVGIGLAATVELLIETIAPATINAAGPRYFGFVTGGVTPAALVADLVTSTLDQNVQVHLPKDSIATTVESLALDMAADLMGIDSRTTFQGKTVTTGATASNILGLACGREFVTKGVLGNDSFSFADDGYFNSPRVVVLHVHGHASLAKAASLLGIGRKNCINLASGPDDCDFDLKALELRLKLYREENTGVIVVASYGEVNTGRFTTEIPEIRALCNDFGAWLHIDAAFGAFAPQSTHLQLADSITSDCHKWLNVPYDCGLFFTRSLQILQQVCTPSFDMSSSGPAYLSSSSSITQTTTALSIPSPLTVGIENSRRFRALPLYASLIALGRKGYQDLFNRNIKFANRVAQWINESKHFELLNNHHHGDNNQPQTVKVSNIVLFAGVKGGGVWEGVDGNAKLVEAINGSRKVYVTGTVWGGRPAVRLAVSNWQTGINGDVSGYESDGNGDPDFEVVKSVLLNVCEQHVWKDMKNT
ncbi:pyridoxal phosphate-dependent transferase [Obelidium mucronatum]|nr:pyridoxal phosphate-dependent transferase [Obelidium mucronatum]